MDRIPENIGELLNDESKRIAALFGPEAKCNFHFGNAPSKGYEVYCSVNPGNYRMNVSEFGATFPEVIAKMEARAATYVHSYRTMTAADLGYSEGAAL